MRATVSATKKKKTRLGRRKLGRFTNVFTAFSATAHKPHHGFAGRDCAWWLGCAQHSPAWERCSGASCLHSFFQTWVLEVHTQTVTPCLHSAGSSAHFVVCLGNGFRRTFDLVAMQRSSRSRKEQMPSRSNRAHPSLTLPGLFSLLVSVRACVSV